MPWIQHTCQISQRHHIGGVSLKRTDHTDHSRLFMALLKTNRLVHPKTYVTGSHLQHLKVITRYLQHYYLHLHTLVHFNVVAASFTFCPPCARISHCPSIRTLLLPHFIYNPSFQDVEDRPDYCTQPCRIRSPTCCENRLFSSTKVHGNS